MGIPGLTTYVNIFPFGEGEVWESFDLRNTNLVIDGSRLYFYIYEQNKLDCKFGGQYDELQKKVKEFISKLQKNSVKPYVVFDGIGDRDEKKSATYIKRNEDKIKKIKELWPPTTAPTAAPTTNPGSLPTESRDYKMVLPRLAKLAVMQVLKEMKVKYAVADFEADCEIASLANKLNAPVLASDSDFYIFDIRRGYIPFENYDFFGPNTKVKKFSSIAFARHLGINPHSMLPLLASLAGNDYISDEMITMLRPFYDRFLIRTDSSNKFKDISTFLSYHNSNSEAINAVIGELPNHHRASVKNALELSIEEYQMERSNLNGYFDSDDPSRTYSDHPLSPRLVGLYRQGLIASEGLHCLCNRKIFLVIQSEDLTLPSTQICVQELRWQYYKLMLNCEGASNTNSTSQDTTEDIVVTEFDREESKRVEKKVSLTRIPEINVENHRVASHILILLDSDLPSIHDLPHKHQLVAAAMRYWVIHSQLIKPAHLPALLVYYVGEDWSLTTKESFEISVEAVHGFAQWQNVLYWAERLNTLFPRTFPPLQVAKLYDGLRVCKVYEKLQHSKGITSAAKSIVTNKDEYNLLFDAIVNPNERPPDDQFNKSPSSERQQNEKDRTLEQKKEDKV